MMPVWMGLSIVIKPGGQIYKAVWVAGFLTLVACMVCLSFSRYLSHQALKHIQTDQPGPALSYLDRVKGILPGFIFRADLQHIHTLLGRACLDLGQRSDDPKLIQRGRDHFFKAVALNPRDINAAKGLARAEGLVNPFGAGLYYKRLLKMRPNGITVHYMAAEYFAKLGRTGDVAAIVSRLAMIAPQDVLNNDLARAGFGGPEYTTAVKEGLKRNLALGIRRRSALLALAKLTKAEGRLGQALSFYEKAMAVDAFRNTDGHFLTLGRLYLDNNDAEMAATAFEGCLSRAENVNKRLGQIFNIYKKKADFLGFDRFGGDIKKKGFDSQTLDLYLARARLGAGLDELARARLLEVVSQRPSAEAYYLLALAAKKQKDWNNMEANIHKATVLAPETCSYYRVFAQALANQGKQAQADLLYMKAGKCSASKN